MRTEGILGFSTADLAEEVRAGLTKPGQKELPSKYFYDDIGSALFEVISLLPEYGLTRADERLLRGYADAMVSRVPGPAMVAELGSGNGQKTRWLLEDFGRRQHTQYFPIEISRAALASAVERLERIDSVSVVGFEKEYLEGLLEVAARRTSHEHILVLFLGSTIGNFDRPAAEQFLRQLRRILIPGDSLLLGTDLEKPVAQLIAAYDDPLGVTKAFNLNLLVRINQELGANFDLRQFEHVVRFDHDERRIEMHLRSACAQSVAIPKAGLTVEFRKNETIWTESSHKYRPDEVVEMAEHTGFGCEAQWVDAEWPFAESLLIAR